MPRKTQIFLIAAGILLVFHLLFPGNAPFINDEPQLLKKAYLANRECTLARRGLEGTFGVHYSPLPVWYYQANLLLTRNPVVMTFVKILLMNGLLLFGLWRLAARLNYGRWPILLALVSPYFYIYNRMLWDNCFLIPVSLLAVVFWTDFVATRKLRWLFLFLALNSLLLHIHLMAVLLLVPFNLALLLGEMPWLLRDRKKLAWVIGGLLALVLICLPYFLTELQHLQPGAESRSASLLTSAGGVLTGARLFSFIGMDYFQLGFFEYGLLPKPLMLLLKWLSALIFVFVGGGIFLTCRSLWRRLSRPRASGLSAGASAAAGATSWWRRLAELEPGDKLGLAGLFTLIATLAFYVCLRRAPYPHYGNAVWPVYFIFAWRFLDECRRRDRRWLALYWVQFGNLALLLTLMIAYIGMNGGNRTIFYGATLGNQLDIARRIVQYSPPPQSRIITRNINNYKGYPQALQILLALMANEQDEEANLPKAEIAINYAEPDNPHSGWLTIEIKQLPPAPD